MVDENRHPERAQDARVEGRVQHPEPSACCAAMALHTGATSRQAERYLLDPIALEEAPYMKTLSLSRYALAGTVIAVLAGCGGGGAVNAVSTVPAVPAGY